MDTAHTAQKILLSVILFLMFVLGILVGGSLFGGSGIKLPSFPNQTRQTAIPNPRAAASLGLEATTTTLQVGKSTQVKVVLTKASADALDVVLTYDPTLLSVSNVVKGTNYPSYPLVRSDRGKLTVSAAVTPDKATPPPPPITVATFTATALKKGTASLTFDKTDTIVAVGGDNILSSAPPLTIIIQ